jgi:hypothetical protein
MTMITLPNGISITDPSSEVLDRILSAVGYSTVGNHVAVEKVIEKVSQATEGNSSGNSGAGVDSEPQEFFKKATGCGHTYRVNSPRGAKATLCPSCKNGGNGNSEVVEDQPKVEQPQRNSGARKNSRKNGGKGKGKRDFSEWLAEHGDELMTPGMEKSIRWMLTNRKITKRFETTVLAALNSEPRITCNVASEYITKLYGSAKK